MSALSLMRVCAALRAVEASPKAFEDSDLQILVVHVEHSRIDAIIEALELHVGFHAIDDFRCELHHQQAKYCISLNSSENVLNRRDDC